MITAFRPPQTTGKMRKVPSGEMNGWSNAWDGADDSELVAAIASTLQGAVSAAMGMAPSPIMSNPVPCMMKKIKSTAIQYPPATFAPVVRTRLDTDGTPGRRSLNLAAQSLSKWKSLLVTEVLHELQKVVVPDVFLKR
jgi:hypothetical protein